MESVASRLTRLMTDKGLNQPKLAEAASRFSGKPVSQQTVQQILSGRNKTSGHLVAIARALGTSSDYLQTGRHPKIKGIPESLLIGKVGAGAEIIRFDEVEVLEGVEAPPGIYAPNCAVISGDSQYPLQEGWRIFYGPENQGWSDKDCLGKLCVVQVKDGATLLKTVKRGTRKDRYRLESWNAPPRENFQLVWVAPVLFIQPR